MAIAAGGGIPSLVQLLRSGSSEAKSNAAAALWNLAVNAENQLKMGQSGAVPLLADMLTATAGAQDGKAHAAGALGNLAASADNMPALARANVVAPLARLLTSELSEARANAAGALGNLAVSPAMSEALSQANVIPALVTMYLAQDSTASAREKAVGTLRRLASMSERNRRAILAEGDSRPDVQRLLKQLLDGP